MSKSSPQSCISLCLRIPLAMSSTSSDSDTASFDDNVNEIRNVILSFLSRCGMTWPTMGYDHDFDAVCRADAIHRGYPMEGVKSLAPFIPLGVVIVTTAYAHITDISTRIFISHFTALTVYVDDAFRNNIDDVRDFNEKFLLRKPQGDELLDCFAALLLELPKRYSRVVSSLILTSTLNAVTAISLEYETQGMVIDTLAYGYPRFARVLSGATEAYAFLAFPPELALQTFIQAIPEIMTYINQGNDMLSFYKEELAGDTVNYVSLVAAQRGMSKVKALWDVADVVVDCHIRTLEILESHPDALRSYESFARGYFGFHVGVQRYKLDELELEGSV